jgi:hypothetical protein
VDAHILREIPYLAQRRVVFRAMGPLKGARHYAGRSWFTGTGGSGCPQQGHTRGSGADCWCSFR